MKNLQDRWKNKNVTTYIEEKEDLSRKIDLSSVNVAEIDMQNAIKKWDRMFRGTNTHNLDNENSLNLPAAIASEVARLVTVELKSHIYGSERADFLNIQYQKILEKLRIAVELAASSGGIIIKPFIIGNEIVVDFIRPNEFIPTAFDVKGNITGAVFLQKIKRNGHYYIKREYHTLDLDGYKIYNSAFISDCEDTLGQQVDLNILPEWQEISPEVFIKLSDGSPLTIPLFTYFKMPLANHICPQSPLGVSVFSRAENLIKQADKQYERILWEFEGSELAIDASAGALKIEPKFNLNNSEIISSKYHMPKVRNRLFRQLELDSSDGGDLYKVFSPTIRDASLFNGLDGLLKRIEFNCFLSYGTLSDPQSVEKTAEEIKMSKQRSYCAISDIQKTLQNSLKELVFVMDMYADLYELAPSGLFETSFTFGDSVTTDTNSERDEMRKDCTLGAASWWEYRMKFYGEDETTAKKMVNEIKNENIILN